MPTFHGSVVHYTGSSSNEWLDFQCGHCNRQVSAPIISSFENTLWLLCPNCRRGSVSIQGSGSHRDIYPGVKIGPSIVGLPERVERAYEEARRTLSVNAFTACELICRKLLMHVAVDKGAKEKDTFSAYLTYLEGQGYITPPIKPWAELIRQNGNEATHLLDEPTKERAEGTLMFTAELLRLIYEMEYLRNQYTPKP